MYIYIYILKPPRVSDSYYPNTLFSDQLPGGGGQFSVIGAWKHGHWSRGCATSFSFRVTAALAQNAQEVRQSRPDQAPPRLARPRDVWPGLSWPGLVRRLEQARSGQPTIGHSGQAWPGQSRLSLGKTFDDSLIGTCKRRVGYPIWWLIGHCLYGFAWTRVCIHWEWHGI